MPFSLLHSVTPLFSLLRRFAVFGLSCRRCGCTSRGAKSYRVKYSKPIKTFDSKHNPFPFCYRFSSVSAAKQKSHTYIITSVTMGNQYRVKRAQYISNLSTFVLRHAIYAYLVRCTRHAVALICAQKFFVTFLDKSSMIAHLYLKAIHKGKLTGTSVWLRLVHCAELTAPHRDSNR